jgi:hypothetical protein
MPFYKRIYSPGELQFITTSAYRRAPLFRPERASADALVGVCDVPKGQRQFAKTACLTVSD